MTVCGNTHRVLGEIDLERTEMADVKESVTKRKELRTLTTFARPNDGKRKRLRKVLHWLPRARIGRK